MRRIAMVLTVLAALVLTTSALATHIPTTGTPIRLMNPAATPTTFAANTPFFVRHGWVCLPEEKAVCLDPTSDFRLYVDGQRAPSALDLNLNISCLSGGVQVEGCTGRMNVSNFRFGLPAGSHSFRGEWWQQGQLMIVREATIQFVG